MKGLRLLLVGFIVFCSSPMFAQAKLGMHIINFPAQINLNIDSSPINANLQIVNYGDKTFDGTVELDYTLNGNFYTGTSGGLLSFNNTTLSIPSGDTVIKSLIIYPNQAAFQTVGTSVVVIWPFSLSALADDSTSYTIQSDSNLTSGLKSLAEINTEVFISKQQLYIQTNTENCLKHLKVYNLQGQLMIDRNLSSSTELGFNSYATGCYLVELTFADNSQKTYKVVSSRLK